MLATVTLLLMCSSALGSKVEQNTTAVPCSQWESGCISVQHQDIINTTSTAPVRPGEEMKETGNDCDFIEEEEEDYWRDSYVILYQDQCDEREIIEKSRLEAELPKVVPEVLVKNVFCLLYNSTLLNCTWTARYHAHGLILQRVTITKENRTDRTCDPINMGDNKVGCHGKLENGKDSIRLNINVTGHGFWYYHSEYYDLYQIEKLNPPQNIQAEIRSDTLFIQWEVPINLRELCFNYSLRIREGDKDDGKVLNLTKDTSITLHNVDLTQRHHIQMRVIKSDSCRQNNFWSDWSEVVEVKASKNPHTLNWQMVVAIMLGIPMFLLAVLLFFRWPRVLKTLFPPIPSPSEKIKRLLDCEDNIRVMSLKRISNAADAECSGCPTVCVFEEV